MTEPDLHPTGDRDDRDDREPPAVERCPSCGALRPPAVAWCTQCYARFDAPGAGPEGPGRTDGADVVDVVDVADGTAAASAAEDEAVPAAVAGAALGPAQRPRDPAVAPVPPEELEARAQEMLARLSVEGDDHGRVRSLSGRLQSRGAKVAVIAAATLLLTGLVLGAMAVLGALL